jgi:hypothetical protein
MVAMLDIMSDAARALARFELIEGDREAGPGDIVEVIEESKLGASIIGERGKLVYEEGSSFWVSWANRSLMDKYQDMITPYMVRLVTEGGEA